MAPTQKLPSGAGVNEAMSHQGGRLNVAHYSFPRDPKVKEGVELVDAAVQQFVSTINRLVSAYNSNPRALPETLQDLWEGAYQSVFTICRQSQVIDIHAGGFDVRSFQPAEHAFAEFIKMANEFLHEIDRTSLIFSPRIKAILAEIKGVIRRVDRRCQALAKRREEIGPYQEAAWKISGRSGLGE